MDGKYLEGLERGREDESVKRRARLKCGRLNTESLSSSVKVSTQ